MTAPLFIDHVAPIADNYDLFLLDQWGVLHDGEKAHDGAPQAMAELKARGKTIILVSNSSKLIPVSIERLSKLGFAPQTYDHVLTSGQLAWEAMKKRSDPVYTTLGRKCLVITKDDNLAFLTGQELEKVESVEEADFLLVADLPPTPVEEIEPMLRAAAARNLPMIVLNPDFASINPAGVLTPCPGLVGRAYEAMGGEIKIHGKPSLSVYETCFKLAPDSKRAIAIGDSLHHDIAGADSAGIDSIFITSGIHALELETTPGARAEQNRVNALCEKFEQCPTYWSTRFVW
jgi:HAD superfamily hydrolase (TIGR01459 family)